MLISAYSSVTNLLFISRSVDVNGVVTGFKEGGGGGFPSRGVVYYPMVKFICCGNEEFEVAGKPGSNPPLYAVGESVQLLFDESKPENAKIYSFSSMWLLPLTGIGLGLFFVSGFFR